MLLDFGFSRPPLSLSDVHSTQLCASKLEIRFDHDLGEPLAIHRRPSAEGCFEYQAGFDAGAARVILRVVNDSSRHGSSWNSIRA